MPKITKAGGPTNAATYPVGILSAPQVEVTADRPRNILTPRLGAQKHLWADYAKALTVDVEGLTKAQIIALVGKS